MTNTVRAAKSADAVRVLIVDDHPVVREGLRLLLDAEPDLAVCGEASGMSQAMRIFFETAPEVVIVDVSLEDGGGIELTKELVAHDANVRILVCSMHPETLYAERALRAGAKGYVGKDQATTRLVEAVRRVVEGRVAVSERMTDRLLCRQVGTGPVVPRSPVESLSDRELEVFDRIGHGATTRQIAERLHLSPKTVETYRENIKSKLSLANATELTQRAVQWVLEER